MTAARAAAIEIKFAWRLRTRGPAAAVKRVPAGVVDRSVAELVEMVAVVDRSVAELVEAVAEVDRSAAVLAAAEVDRSAAAAEVDRSAAARAAAEVDRSVVDPAAVAPSWLTA
jgi:hypothetical protein